MCNISDVLSVIKDAWGWTGIEPQEIVSDNAFGNLIVKDTRGVYWRICPEDACCQIVAQNNQSFRKILKDPEFLDDWNMEALTRVSQDALGVPPKGSKYCFVTLGALGGEYSVDNIKIAPLIEIVGLSGEIAQQIDGLADGSKVQLKITE